MLQSIAVSTPNLLIVDDDEQILDCFRCTFSLDQLSLQTATNAAEALCLFREVPFDVVIADVRLPDSYGIHRDSLDNKLPGGWVFAGIEIVYRGFKSCQWNSVLGKRLCWTTSGQSAVLGSGVQPPLQNPR